MLGTTQGKLLMALGLLEYAKIILFTSANIHKTNGFDLLVVTGFMKMCYIPVHFPCELILAVNKHHRLVVYIFLKICDQNVLLFSSYKSLRDSLFHFWDAQPFVINTTHKQNYFFITLQTPFINPAQTINIVNERILWLPPKHLLLTKIN